MHALFGRRSVLFAAVLLLLGSSVAALGLRAGAPRKMTVVLDPSGQRRVQPAELARWIIEGRRDFTLVDLRDDARYQAGHVRDAVHCGTCHETKGEGRSSLEDHFVDLSRKLVLYSETGREKIELPQLLARNPHLVLLEGGWQAFQAEVLAPVVFGGETDAAAIEDKQRREAIRAYFAGERAGTATPAQLPVTPIRRDSAHSTAAAHEGC